MSIDWEFSGAGPLRKWRNLVTGECRTIPPSFGELDWVEMTRGVRCSD
jgi:hypothetical protein